MLDQVELIKLKKGDIVNHYLLVKKSEEKLTKSNKVYINLELSDKSASITANLWDNFENLTKHLVQGEIVKIEGKIEDFQGTPQIRIDTIRLRKKSENIKAIEFLPRSEKDIEEMRRELSDRINKIDNDYIKQLLGLIFSGKTLELFSIVPAGKSWHHAYIHGLIEHTLEIVRICDLSADFHSEINRDLLVCGALLHDIGKIEELSSEINFEYTDKGRLLGHITIATLLIDKTISQIPNFPPLLKDLLLHLVLSHQGKHEYATPVLPKTLEAITLYQADELSAKMNAYKYAVRTDNRIDSNWTKFIPLISTELFKLKTDF